MIITASALPDLLQTDSTLLVNVGMKDPVSGTSGQGVSNLACLVFDLDGEGSAHSGSPHTCPNAEAFTDYLGKLGIERTSNLVVFDNFGLFCAPRLWWMLRGIDHPFVSVLSGGSAVLESADVVVPLVTPQAVNYEYSGDISGFVNAQQVLDAMGSSTQIIDARAAARFYAQVPEPRPGLRSGHIPGAISLPFTELLDANKQLLSRDVLTDIFASRDIDLTRPIIVYCGSGITACVVALAAVLLGAKAIDVYDGSWSEWGADPSLPLEVN